MNIALVCIAKNENRYIREFIKYYLNLGVDKIIIGDNNDEHTGEWIEPIVDDYIEKNIISIVNLRGLKSDISKNISVQYDYYNAVYNQIRNIYDWIIFVDCDEFITLTDCDNIKDFLSKDCFNNYDVIHLNWMCYNDGNNIYDNGKPVLNRFLTKVDITDNVTNILNKHMKSIIKGGINIDTIFNGNSHTPWYKDLKYCNNEGIETKFDDLFKVPASYKYAYIKHYVTKSLEEYINQKFDRGAADYTNKQYNISNFFGYNNTTQEKLDYLKTRNIIYNQYDNVSVAVVCMIKNENQYLREFIEYYKKLGVTNIILYDNNDIDGEIVYSVINDYINSGYVILYNIKEIHYKGLQLDVYNEVYLNYYNKYDWFIFIDCDEYIILNKHNSIQEYLSQDKFKEAQCIELFWKVYGDNNMIYSNGKPLIDRFTEESTSDHVKYFHNRFCKPIVKGHLEQYSHNNLFTYDMHVLFNVSNICDCNGNKYFLQISPVNDPIYGDAHINHYMTKTISEFIKQKYLGLDANYNDTRCSFEYFFLINDITQEKIDYIKSKGLEFDIDKLNESMNEQKRIVGYLK